MTRPGIAIVTRIGSETATGIEIAIVTAIGTETGTVTAPKGTCVLYVLDCCLFCMVQMVFIEVMVCFAETRSVSAAGAAIGTRKNVAAAAARAAEVAAVVGSLKTGKTIVIVVVGNDC